MLTYFMKHKGKMHLNSIVQYINDVQILAFITLVDLAAMKLRGLLLFTSIRSIMIQGIES